MVQTPFSTFGFPVWYLRAWFWYGYSQTFGSKKPATQCKGSVPSTVLTQYTVFSWIFPEGTIDLRVCQDEGTNRGQEQSKGGLNQCHYNSTLMCTLSYSANKLEVCETWRKININSLEIIVVTKTVICLVRRSYLFLIRTRSKRTC